MRREQGHVDALDAFGLKVALDWSALGTGLRNQIVGEPGRAWKQIQDGKYLAPGGLVREFALPTHSNPMMQKGLRALSLGLPALGVASALSEPSSRRGSAVGGALGMAAGGALGAPFGIAGSIVGGGVLSHLGRSVGSAFDSEPRQFVG